MRLGQLFSNQPFTPIPSLADDAQAALLTQDSIGWANFFEGCIAQEWEAIQEAYFHWCRSRKTGRRWTASLIQKLWDISWDLWEHRIGIVHDRKNEAILYNMTAVDQEIRTQFHRGPHGLHLRDQQLFAGTLQDILGASVFYHQRWLHRAETARARACELLPLTARSSRPSAPGSKVLPLLNRECGLLICLHMYTLFKSFYYWGRHALENLGDIKAFGH
jgi:hypothetical protein